MVLSLWRSRDDLVYEGLQAFLRPVLKVGQLAKMWKKSKSKRSGGAERKIPAAVMARLGQAFQEPGSPELSCPEPEQVIACALVRLAQLHMS